MPPGDSWLTAPSPPAPGDVEQAWSTDVTLTHLLGTRSTLRWMSVRDREAHPSLFLSSAEVVGLTGLLWELGGALKDTTGDPDCVAPELYHEAARLEHEIGLPAWPTDDVTRETLAAYYDAAADNLEPGRAADPTASIEVSDKRQLALAQLIGRSLVYLGSEAIGSREVNLSVRAVLWVRVLSEA